MNLRLACSKLWERLVRRILAARFLTFSLLLHLAILGVAGTVILNQPKEDAPDFAAGNDGLLMEPEVSASPPADAPGLRLEPQLPALTLPTAAPVSALVTAAQVSPWSAATQKLPVRGMRDWTKSGLASMGNQMPSGGSSGAFGRSGGTRTAMIFGRSITANRLGVILDVSGSGHAHLAGAVAEIQRGFADAILILYPGCGLTQPDAKPGHEIRRFSSLTKKDLENEGGFFTTASQLIDALKIKEFEAMTQRPGVRDSLFVSWYTGESAGGKAEGSFEKLIGQTQVAFEELLKRRVDAIYWFSDFADDVDGKVAERLTDQLKGRRVKLHLHNFAGELTNPIVTEMAAKTGGSSNARK